AEVEERRSGQRLRVAAEWAPAYELLLSIHTYVQLKPHALFELGPLWVRSIHDQLPAEIASRFARKSVAHQLKDAHDLLLQLVHVCPEKVDVAAFLDWFGQLTPGGAYEALAPLVPEPGPRLPRDFNAWRDALLDLLGSWHGAYFRHL